MTRLNSDANLNPRGQEPVASLADAPPPASMATGRVLVVHPQESVGSAIAAMLKPQGYTVTCVVTSTAALTAAQTDPPDVMLVALTLPAIAGTEVCQTLKANPKTREIPVIFIHDGRSPHDPAALFAIGGADYVSEPLRSEELIARVQLQLTVVQQRRAIAAQQQQLQAETQQRQVAEARYRSIFEQATEGIFKTSVQGQFIEANPVLVALYGYDSVEELQESVTDIGKQLYVEPHRRQEIQAYLQQHDRALDMESEVYRKDGTRFWVSENIRTVRDAAGKVIYYEGTVQDISARHKAEAELQQQRRRVERLLYNTLPYQIAFRLQRRSSVIAEHFDLVTVLFADLVGFTQASAGMSPEMLVELLNSIFSRFDILVDRYGVEKIKTVGDEYMVAGGLPNPEPDHVLRMARLAIAMQEAISTFTIPDGKPLTLRIGMNTGPVVAGVIGTKKLAYDLWGDTVNVASRMETAGLPGRIQVTEATYQRLRSHFVLEPRGEIEVKGKGPMMTYWLLHER